MKKAALLVCSLLMFVGIRVEAQIALSPDVGQIFGCTLADGKTMENVWSSLEALAKIETPSQAPPDPEFSIFLWTQLRGSMPYDFVLGVNNGDMNRLAQGLTDIVSTPAWDAWAQRFDDTADCISGIVKSEQIRAGKLGMTAGRSPVAIVETFACNVKEGAKAGALESALEYFKDNYEKIDSAAAKDYSAWLWRPYRGTSGTWDFMFVGANPDLKSWAQSSMDYDASKEGQAADAMFNAMSTCRTTLWTGYWIVAPTTP